MPIKSFVSRKSIVISTHVFVTGPSQDLKEYLLENRVGKLLFIGHPLFYDKTLKNSSWQLYNCGKLTKERTNKLYGQVNFLSYIKHTFLNICWTIKRGSHFNLYIGFDCLNAFSGIILRKLGIVRRTIYYVIDYNPKRFSNIVLNSIYHKLDQFCAYYSDETWNLSYRMTRARKEYFNFTGRNQKIVPIGIWFNKIKRSDFNKIDQNMLVFMGWLIESKGVQHVLGAIPLIIKEIPKFKFVIVGHGSYSEKLKGLTEKLNIKKYVCFKGFIEDPREVEKILSKGACSVALYEKYENGNLTYTYFTEPAKLKSYLACGLPVLVTDVPVTAKGIERNKCGFIISLEKENIAKAVIAILQDVNTLKTYRENAITYAKNYDWNIIFENNLSRVLKNI